MKKNIQITTVWMCSKEKMNFENIQQTEIKMQTGLFVNARADH